MKYSIITNNCNGGKIESILLGQNQFMTQYRSPFVSSLFPNDNQFFKFCSNYDYYIQCPPVFGEQRGESWLSCHESPFHGYPTYPIVHLDDIDIHFSHNHSQQEVFKQYHGRLQSCKIYQPLFVFSFSCLYCLHSQQEISMIVDRFMQIKYPSIMLTNRKSDEFDDGIHICKYIPEWENTSILMDGRHPVGHSRAGFTVWEDIINPVNILVDIINKRFL